MSGTRAGETESEITSDPATIRNWADEHAVVPVRSSRGGTERVRMVPSGRQASRHEELTWQEFFDELEGSEMVVIHHDDEHRPLEVVEHQEAVDRTTAEDESIGEALLSGETVTSTITETRVVERTIVEEVELESQVVDRVQVESDIVDAEFLERTVDSCEVTDVRSADERDPDLAMFEVGYHSSDDLDAHVEVDVDEAWTLTKEVLERLTIESRVVEAGGTETDTLETDTISETVGLEGIERAIVGGDLVDTEAEEVVETHTIQSDFAEGDTVETTLLERKTVDEEVMVRRRLAGEIREGDTSAVESVHRETVESELLQEEELAEVEALSTPDEWTTVEGEPVATGTVDTADVGATSAGTTGTGADARTTSTETDAGTADVETTEAGMEGTDERATEEVRTMPSEDDEGKPVVDAAGEKIGMVAEVEGTAMYVDPRPSLTDRIKAALDWGDHDDDDYPIDPDQVERITDDEVVLAVTDGK